jgi:hypothetical protein
MVKTKESDGSTDSGEERDRNDDNAKSTSKCAHVNKSVVVAKIKKLLKNNGLASSCVECEKDKKILNSNDDENEDEYDQSLWMCLKCGIQLCGRARNKHALQHYEVTFIIINKIKSKNYFSRNPKAKCMLLTLIRQHFRFGAMSVMMIFSMIRTRNSLIACRRYAKQLARKKNLQPFLPKRR